MSQDYLTSCSYKELKQLAVQHDLSIKSKKKDALLSKLLDYFMENPDKLGFDEGKENIPHILDAGKNIEVKLLSNPEKNQVENAKNNSKRGKRGRAKSNNEASTGEVLTPPDHIETKVVSGSVDNNLLENAKNNSKRGKRGRAKSNNESTLDEAVLTQDQTENFGVSPQKKVRKARKVEVQSENASTDESTKKILLPLPDDQTEKSENFGVSPQKKVRKARKLEVQSENASTDKSTKKILLPLPDDTSDRRGTFVVSDKGKEVSTQESCSSPEKSNKRGRGRQFKSKEVILECTTDNSLPSLDSCNSPEKNNKKGEKKFKSKEVVVVGITENTLSAPVLEVEAKDLSQTDVSKVENAENNSKRGKRGRAKSNNEPISVEVSESAALPPSGQLENPTNSEVSLQKKSRKGRKVQPKCEDVSSTETSTKVALPLPDDTSDRRGTFVISDKVNEVSAQENSTSPQKSNKRGKAKQTSKEEVVEESTLSSSVISKRRDTYVVADKVEEIPVLDKSISAFKKNNTSVVAGLPKAMKKVGVAIPVTKKNVNFITPEASRLRTPKKSNVSVTPHPIKKSISTPLPKKSLSTPFSVKKTPGQFSAKKMPNFAKIHKKNFDKMENLVTYTERKTAKMELFSPLNKTFTGLSTNEKVVNKLRSSLGRKPAKSLIPVRSGVIRLEDTEKINAFAQKKHVTNVEAIREKERNVIKGVRANKRFMLQMRMRKLAP